MGRIIKEKMGEGGYMFLKNEIYVSVKPAFVKP